MGDPLTEAGVVAQYIDAHGIRAVMPEILDGSIVDVAIACALNDCAPHCVHGHADDAWDYARYASPTHRHAAHARSIARRRDA